MEMTQRDLAGELGVSTNTVARWERNEVEMRHPQMLRLALDAVRHKRGQRKLSADDHIATRSPTHQTAAPESGAGTLFRLAERGATFATRERAEALASGIPEGDVTIDFSGVKAASPSFLDGLIGVLSERTASTALTGLTVEMEQLAGLIVARRGVGGRFRLPAA